MKIVKIEKASIAEELGIVPGDELISINGHEIEDKLDYQFYGADEDIDMLVKHNGVEERFKFERDFDEEIGLVLEAMTFRLCGNNCVFCFVYQNPDGMRPTLYIKDEDFRLSFLYGNYTTLTNAKQRDLDKIVEQRLSPQYVSIHATDLEARKILLGTKKDDKLIEKLRFLVDNRIELHGQIVLCPEINDGEILHKTIADLMTFQPYFKSIAIVPVGLTKHREGLLQLRVPDKTYANNFIDEVDTIREKCQTKIDAPFVYCSDEWYIIAEREIPEDEYYEDFFQVENGVGICREFINSVREQSEKFPSELKSEKELTLVTASSAGKIMNEDLMPYLNKIGNLKTNLEIVENKFFGDAITVSGLLTGEDIYNHLVKSGYGDLIVLPPRCLNPDGLFLDNWSPAQIEEKLERKVIIYPHDMNDVINILELETVHG